MLAALPATYRLMSSSGPRGECQDNYFSPSGARRRYIAGRGCQAPRTKDGEGESGSSSKCSRTYVRRLARLALIASAVNGRFSGAITARRWLFLVKHVLFSSTLLTALASLFLSFNAGGLLAEIKSEIDSTGLDTWAWHRSIYPFLIFTDNGASMLSRIQHRPII